MSQLLHTLRKFVVSGFVVFSFVAYALHERVIHSAAPIAAEPGGQTAIALIIPTPSQLVPTPSAIPVTVLPSPTVPPATAVVVPTAPDMAVPTAQPSPVPTGTPVPTEPQPTAPLPTSSPAAATALAGAHFKDGQYTGTVADAYYGPLQVQAVIKQGKITGVQFLDYPHDRRTSQRINSQAMPYLQEEAIQAQSAQVDLISGATLTSQAFVESLQAALNNAKA